MAVLEGRGRHVLSDRTQSMEAGDVLFVRPRDLHAMEGWAPAGLRFINVAFPATHWRTFLHLAEATDSWETAEAPPRWRLTGDAAGRARAVFEVALARCQRNPTMVD